MSKAAAIASQRPAISRTSHAEPPSSPIQIPDFRSNTATLVAGAQFQRKESPSALVTCGAQKKTGGISPARQIVR